jgi:hypothetical protein
MRNVLIAALALASLPAAAADFPPVKALPPVRATCPVGTGFYAGVNTYAQVANGTTSATVGGTSFSVNTLSDGAALGLTVGYAFGDCVSGRFYAIEGLFDYQNLSGTNGVGITVGGAPLASVSTSINSKYEFTQRFKVGANLSDVMAFLPSFGTIFPGVPTPAPGTSNPKAYIAAVVRESDVSASFDTTGSPGASSPRTWAVEPGIGVGIQSATATGAVVDVFTDYTFKGGGFTFGGVTGRPGDSTTANLGGVFRGGIQVLY